MNDYYNDGVVFLCDFVTEWWIDIGFCFLGVDKNSNLPFLMRGLLCLTNELKDFWKFINLNEFSLKIFCFCLFNTIIWRKFNNQILFHISTIPNKIKYENFQFCMCFQNYKVMKLFLIWNFHWIQQSNLI